MMEGKKKTHPVERRCKGDPGEGFRVPSLLPSGKGTIRSLRFAGPTKHRLRISGQGHTRHTPSLFHLQICHIDALPQSKRRVSTRPWVSIRASSFSTRSPALPNRLGRLPRFPQPGLYIEYGVRSTSYEQYRLANPATSGPSSVVPAVPWSDRVSSTILSHG